MVAATLLLLSVGFCFGILFICFVYMLMLNQAAITVLKLV